MQVGLEPLLVVACLNRQNFTVELIRESKKFSVSILSQEAPLPFIGRFGFRSGRDFEKFDASVRHRVLESGDPIVLDHTVGYLDLAVEREIELSTHSLFIGRVVEAAVLAPEKEPMTYAFYHNVKKGLTQKNAPTYNKP